MHSSRSSTSKAWLILACLAGLGSVATAVLLRNSLAVLALAFGLGLCAMALAIRAVFRRRSSDVIEPSFETSILAFPPEPKFERRLSARS